MDLSRTHQLRPPGETQWYAPARDITCFTPVAIRAALEAWEDTDNVYRQQGVDSRLYTDEDICHVCEALAALCSQECIVEPAGYMEALERSGLTEVPFHLRMVFMALIGEQFLSGFWIGIRGATTKIAGEEEYQLVQYDPELLVQAAQRMCRLMRMPRWKRRAYVWVDTARRRLVSWLKGGE